MNSGATTAFLPKFVRFPSLRGLHSSTVQLRRARGARPGNSRAPAGPVPSGGRPGPGGGGRPVPAASPAPVASVAPAAAAATARGAPAAGRAATAGGATAARGGVPSPAGVVAAVMAAGRRSAVRRARGPPAVAAVVRRRGPGAGRAGPTGRAGPALGEARALPAGPLPARAARRPRDDQQREQSQTDTDLHGAALLPFPRSGPPWAPRCHRLACGDRGMPGRRTRQSGVEEVQSLGAGWPA